MPSGAGFRFGPFVLDSRTRTLMRGGSIVALSARHFDLLHALVARAGDILTKDELIQAGWPNVAIGDNSLSQAMTTIRDVLDPDVRKRYIATCSGLGYQSLRQSSLCRFARPRRICTRCSRRIAA